MIKTYRGLLTDGQQDTIRLSTNNGLIGYRIIKFELFPNTPGAASFESVVKIYKREQTSIDGVVDFDDQALLAASFIGGYTSVANSTLNETTIMEHEVFNQDVFITHSEVDGSASCNYYIEMEQMKLAGDEATVATLKDMRGRE